LLLKHLQRNSRLFGSDKQAPATTTTKPQSWITMMDRQIVVR
jgi:hypothetical protein